MNGLLKPRVKPMPSIAVLLKQVPDTNARIEFEGGRVALGNVKMVTSPYDEFALETALRHKEATGGSVTAICVGGPGADKVLKDAKALGADDLIRVWSEGWASLDSRGLQTVLASVVRDLGADVVYCGRSAADTGAGSTGPGLAERLGWPSASNVTSTEFAEDHLLVGVPTSDGTARTHVPIPAVISCDKGDLKVRKANVKSIMQAKRATIDVRSVEAPASVVTIIQHSPPPAKPAGKSFEGGDAATEVARLLREEANII